MELINFIVLVLAVAYTFFMLGWGLVRKAKDTGYKRGWNKAKQVYYSERKDVHTDAERDAYLRGLADGKQIYYTDRLNSEREEQAYVQKGLLKTLGRIDTENRKFNPITSELLMAYGVVRVGDLPETVKAFYGVTEEMSSVDLDTMLRNEQQEEIADA